MTLKSLREVFQEFWRNIEGTNVYPIKERNRQIDNLISDIERIIVPEKREAASKYSTGDTPTTEYCYGYNACIDDMKARIKE